MREEFHGSNGAPYKQLYGWGTINANIWLPSLSELVGTDPDHYHDPHGCYFSAMQGLNTSEYACVDMQGGAQFAYFQQFNASGGGSAVMNTCKQEAVWTRSPVYYYADCANVFNNAGGILHTPATASHAVLVGTSYVSFAYPRKDKGKAHSLHCSSSSQQSRLCWESYIHIYSLPPFCDGRAYWG